MFSPYQCYSLISEHQIREGGCAIAVRKQPVRCIGYESPIFQDRVSSGSVLTSESPQQCGQNLLKSGFRFYGGWEFLYLK